MENKYEFKSLKSLTIVTIILAAVMTLGIIVSTVLEQIILRNYYPMANSDQIFTLSSNYGILDAYGIFLYLRYISQFGLIIFFLWWVYRANKNIHFFGAKNIYSPKMSVIWFLIPLINLWKGYQAIKQIWKASNPRVVLVTGDEWKSQNMSLRIVILWWISQIIIYAVYGALTGFASAKGSVYITTAVSVFSYSDTLLILTALIIAFSLLLLLPTISGIKLVRQVSTWQDIKGTGNEINLGGKE